jgi:hypothetical protein
MTMVRNFEVMLGQTLNNSVQNFVQYHTFVNCCTCFVLVSYPRDSVLSAQLFTFHVECYVLSLTWHYIRFMSTCSGLGFEESLIFRRFYGRIWDMMARASGGVSLISHNSSHVRVFLSVWRQAHREYRHLRYETWGRMNCKRVSSWRKWIHSSPHVEAFLGLWFMIRCKMTAFRIHYFGM